MQDQVGWHHGVPNKAQLGASDEGVGSDMSALANPSSPTCSIAAMLSPPRWRASPNAIRASSSSSTTASARRSRRFRKRWPERTINVGIAEQNMVGVGAGLANGGKIPFVSAASCFLTGSRARADQGRHRLYQRQREARRPVARHRLRRTGADASFDRRLRLAAGIAQSRDRFARRSLGDRRGGEGRRRS